MPWLIQNSSPWRRVFKLNCLSVVALACTALLLLPTPRGKWVFYHLQGMAWRRNLELREGWFLWKHNDFKEVLTVKWSWPCHGHYTQESDKQLGAWTSDTISLYGIKAVTPISSSLSHLLFSPQERKICINVALFPWRPDRRHSSSGYLHSGRQDFLALPSTALCNVYMVPKFPESTELFLYDQ